MEIVTDNPIGGLKYRDCDTYVVDEVLNKKAYKHLDISKDDVVLDLGAHVGSFVKWSLDHGAREVIAVEMTPETLKFLYENVGRDPRVSIVSAAVVSSTVSGSLRQRRYQNPMSASIMPFNSEDPDGIVVPTVQIDDLLRAHKPNKLKFDIEGSEYDALLRDAEAVTASPVTRIMGELHTRTDEMFQLARGFWHTYVDLGWTPSKHIRDFPAKATGWNVIMHFHREKGGRGV